MDFQTGAIGPLDLIAAGRAGTGGEYLHRQPLRGRGRRELTAAGAAQPVRQGGISYTDLLSELALGPSAGVVPLEELLNLSRRVPAPNRGGYRGLFHAPSLPDSLWRAYVVFEGRLRSAEDVQRSVARLLERVPERRRLIVSAGGFAPAALTSEKIAAFCAAARSGG